MPIGTTWTTSVGAGLLKVIYPTEKVHSAVNTKNPITSLFKSYGQPFSTEQGQSFQIPIELALSDGSATKSEFTAIPEAQAPVVDKASWTFGAYERPISLSAHSAVLGGGFKKPLMYNVDAAIRAMSRDFEEMFFLPYSGLRANVVSASASTTLVVDDGTYLRVGMPIDVLVKTTGADTAGVVNSKITAVSVSSSTGYATLTLESALLDYASVDTTYGVYKTRTYNTGFWGLPDIISASNPGTTTYLGNLDRTSAANALWKAQNLDLSGDDVSPGAIATMVDQIQISSGMECDFAIAHPAQIATMMEQQLVNRRADYSETTFPIWGSGLTFKPNSMPIYPSRFCPKATIYMGNHELIQFAYPKINGMNERGSWVTAGDSRLSSLSIVDNKIGILAVWLQFMQVVAIGCNGLGSITSCKIPSSYVAINPS